MADSDRRSVAVIDGNSLMHRAFHAVSANMTAPNGDPTNAVFGFMSMFLKLVQDFHPWGIAVCFDKGQPAVRMEMLPQYKAQRPPMDEALAPQFPMVKDLLAALAVPVVELEGWEGDDLLGTLAREGVEQGFDMYLVTGDRDMYQLTNDHVKVVSTRKGMSDVAIMTPEAVADLYGGITPDLVPDFYGLKGDSSDNIPGVPGIGPKKAQALIEQYGSLDGVIAHADEVKGKMGENLRAHIDDALLSRRVATILCDAPVELDFESTEFPSFDVPTAKEAFAKLGFTAVATRMLKLVDKNAAMDDAPATVATALKLPEPVCGDAAREALAKAADEGQWLGVAMDADGEVSLFGSRSLWVAVDAGLLRFDGEEADAVLVQCLEEHRVAAVDVKGLIHEVYPMNSAEPAALDITRVAPDSIFDVAVAAYLLDSAKSSYTPSELAEQFLELAAPAEANGAALAAYVSHWVQPAMVKLLDQAGAISCFNTIEMPLVPCVAQMERTGMHADAAEFREQTVEVKAIVKELGDRIYAEAGERFNIGSPTQLSHVLFDVLKLPTDGLKKTKRGFYSTNAKVLEDLAQQSQLVADVIDYREKDKILKTYLENLPREIRSDGRIHTTFNQTVTATGRLSSSDPNLQNIPVRSELGRRVRSAFTVPEGWTFLSVDYSQIELRLLAHLSGDEHLIRAFNEGEDFHAETAARVFGVPVSEVSPLMRARAKAVNFGIVYGQGAYGLSQTIRTSTREAQEMIDRYFEAYPGVRRYLDQVVADARELGYVETLFGRRRLVPDINAKNANARAAAERTAMNHPEQGSAADIIKIAMTRVQQELENRHLKSELIMQIHDELDLQVPMEELDEVTALVVDIMQGVVDLRVPLVADPSHGKTWAEAK